MVPNERACKALKSHTLLHYYCRCCNLEPTWRRLNRIVSFVAEVWMQADAYPDTMGLHDFCGEGAKVEGAQARTDLRRGVQWGRQARPVPVSRQHCGKRSSRRFGAAARRVSRPESSRE